MSTFIKYLKFFSARLGIRLYFLFFIALAAAILEVISITFFIPLLAGLESETEINKIIREIFIFAGFDYNLNTILILIFSLILLRTIFLIFEGAIRGKILSDLLVDLRFDLSKKVFGLSYLEFLNYSSGYINNALITELNRLIFSFKLMISLIIMGLFSIAYVILPAIFNPFIVILPVAFGLIILPIIKILNIKTKNVSIETSKYSAGIQTFFLQAFNSFKYLKATNNEENLQEKIHSESIQYGKKQYQESLLQSISQFAFEPLLALSVVIIIFYSINYSGTNLVEIFILIAMVVNSLRKLLGMQQNYRKILNTWGSIGVIERLQEELKHGSEINTQLTYTNDIDDLNNLCFENVTFAYNNMNVLQNVSFCIKSGEKLGIVGESGSGKSTLVNLLIGLLHPSKGIVSYNGISIKEIGVSDFRSNVGYVTQENVIFNDTIKNNITLWQQRPSQQKLKNVCKLANIENYIENLDKKYDTLLGESGLNISGGQRQRICIARELYRDNKIIIFDEATSALDTENEIFIRDSIIKSKSNISMVIVAHRLSTIINCDKIICLHKGKIIESGNFKELMKKEGHFSKLYNLQTADEI